MHLRGKLQHQPNGKLHCAEYLPCLIQIYTTQILTRTKKIYLTKMMEVNIVSLYPMYIE